MATNTTPTLNAALPEGWAQMISSEVDASILTWEVDTACGEEVLRIVRLADYVASCWPDAREDVITAAIHQISVVCLG